MKPFINYLEDGANESTAPTGLEAAAILHLESARAALIASQQFIPFVDERKTQAIEEITNVLNLLEVA